MRIFLLGFMGSGKSHVGKRLAKRLGLPFVDLDQYLEYREQMPISRIFSEMGESHFRFLETKYLHETSDFHNFIVAAGGGTPCYGDNMNWMNAHGITIYLKTPTDIIWERLCRKKAKRPLIAHKSDEEIRFFIQQTLTIREKYYEKAKIIYERKSEQEDVVENLSNFLQYRLPH